MSKLDFEGGWTILYRDVWREVQSYNVVGANSCKECLHIDGVDRSFVNNGHYCRWCFHVRIQQTGCKVPNNRNIRISLSIVRLFNSECTWPVDFLWAGLIIKRKILLRKDSQGGLSLTSSLKSATPAPSLAVKAWNCLHHSKLASLVGMPYHNLLGRQYSTLVSPMQSDALLVITLPVWDRKR